MQALRTTYESLGPMIPVPVQLQSHRTEVIWLDMGPAANAAIPKAASQTLGDMLREIGPWEGEVPTRAAQGVAEVRDRFV